MTIQFYTYLHCRPDGTPFYVGKGNNRFGKRSHEFRRRNQYHQHIVSKYGRENILIYIFPCESEEQAFADEAQQIAQLRQAGYSLCNLTDGGEGSSGRVNTETRSAKLKMAWTPERKAKHKIQMTGNKFGIGNPGPRGHTWELSDEQKRNPLRNSNKKEHIAKMVAGRNKQREERRRNKEALKAK